MAIKTLLFLGALTAASTSQAAINYIGEEEAESVRLCHYYRQQIEEAKSGIRDATVGGGQKVGLAAEANALRTKLRFKKKFLERKIAENCESPDDTEPEAQVSSAEATE